ncbi:MAG: hypothetical protein IJ871_08330 [Ruminococcus sp.]|nr:hypothetical protein [Ruminococcus sp.]
MAVKKTEEKVEAVKAAAEKKTEEVKAVAKKAATATKTKAAAAKTAVKVKADTAKKKAAEKKTAAKKPAAKKAAAKDEVFVQVEGVNEINVAAVVDAAKADYKAKSGKAAKAVTVYVKPAEGVAYYTVAGKGSDDYKVDL